MQNDAPRPRREILPANVAIRPATLHDLAYIRDLQKRFGHAVGFLPNAALVEHLEAGNTVIALENGQPAGYCVQRLQLKTQPMLSPIVQMCVSLDAQRRHIGAALLAEAKDRCHNAGLLGVQANCAIGVEANAFWSAVGFVPICHFTPQNTRKRELICWRLPLTKKIPLWFTDPPKLAGFPARPVVITRNPTRSEFAHEIASRYITRRSPAQLRQRPLPPVIRPPDEIQIEIPPQQGEAT